MLSLLRTLYFKFEEIKGKSLLYLILAIFVGFLLFGLILGYFTNKILNNNEQSNSSNKNQSSALEEISYEGKIKFVDPKTYPEDEISFTLVDSSGKQVILLKARDQILMVAENQYATVYGTKVKTNSGKDVLLVEKLSIKNVSN